MRRTPKLFLMVLVSATVALTPGNRADSAQQKVCTQDEAKHAEDGADTLKDWDSVYRSFKRYAHCDDGAIAEGYSDSIGRLLAGGWNHVDALSHLASSDKAFEQFVLRHIDETLSSDGLKAIADNATLRCPPGQDHLCRLIEARAKDSASADEPRRSVVLGVLEDLPGHYGPPNFRAVRAVFQKVGGSWLPFRTGCQDGACLKAITSEYPAEVTWTIAFDGKNLGKVTARTPKDFKFYYEIGLEAVA